MTDRTSLFVESFVAVIEEARRRRRLKKGDFAALVWPDMAPRSSNQRWQYIRKERPSMGRPLDMTLADAEKMAKVLEQDLIHLILKAQERAYQLEEEAKAKAAKPRSRPKTAS